MQHAIKILEEERSKIIFTLKEGRQEQLSNLQQLDKALSWLKILEGNQMENAKKYLVHQLPFPDGYGYSCYRLMIDCETDNIEEWIEYKGNETPLSLIGGDIVITSK